jgi:hypothetical protein
MEIPEIPKDKLVKDPCNARQDDVTNTDSFATLVDNIRRNGFDKTKPLIVRHLPSCGHTEYGDKYGIMDGWERYTANIQATCGNVESYPITIRNVDDVEARIISLGENESKTSLTNWEKFCSFKEIIKNKKDVDFTGALSYSMVDKFKKINRLPSCFHQFILPPDKREENIKEKIRNILLNSYFNDVHQRTKELNLDTMVEISNLYISIHEYDLEQRFGSFRGFHSGNIQSSFAESQTLEFIAFLLNRNFPNKDTVHFYIKEKEKNPVQSIFDIFKDNEDRKNKDKKDNFSLPLSLPNEYQNHLSAMMTADNLDQLQTIIELSKFIQLIIRDKMVREQLKNYMKKEFLIK